MYILKQPFAVCGGSLLIDHLCFMKGKKRSFSTFRGPSPTVPCGRTFRTRPAGNRLPWDRYRFLCWSRTLVVGDASRSFDAWHGSWFAGLVPGGRNSVKKIIFRWDVPEKFLDVTYSFVLLFRCKSLSLDSGHVEDINFVDYLLQSGARLRKIGFFH